MTQFNRALHHVSAMYTVTDSQRRHNVLTKLKIASKAFKYQQPISFLEQGIGPELFENIQTIHPGFLRKIMRSHISRKFSKKLSTKLLCDHYRFVEEKFPDEVKNAIYCAGSRAASGFEVLQIVARDESIYKVKLTFDPSFQREGELTLKIEDPQGANFYSVTLTIIELEGKTQLVIGGLQGPRSTSESKKNIKVFTKSLHGLRPKDLMVKLAAMLGNALQVDKLLGIRTNAHPYAKKPDRLKFNYDSHWTTLGALDFDDSFVELPLVDPRKSEAEMTQSKRAMYRRRFEWLDSAQDTFIEKLTR